MNLIDHDGYQTLYNKIINKVISLKIGYYRIIPHFSSKNKYICFINDSNRKILRHQFGYIHENKIQDDEQLILDSKFLPVFSGKGITFFATNKDLEHSCITYQNGELRILPIDEGYKFTNTFCLKQNLFPDEPQVINQSCKIFVAYHYDTSRCKTEFLEPVHAGRSIASKETKESLQDIMGDDTGDNISHLNNNYCELTIHYWAWKNTNFDIIGLMHYRRIFNLSKLENSKISFKEFNNNIIEKAKLNENILDLMKRYDIIVPEIYNTHPGGMPNQIMTNYDFFDMHHDIKYYELMEEAIYNLYPQFWPVALYYHNAKKSFFFNMFIMKRKIFEDYSKFLFDILDYIKSKDTPKFANKYQARYMGFISERLLNIFICKLKFIDKVKIKHAPVINKVDIKQIEYKTNEIKIDNKYKREKTSVVNIAFSCNANYIMPCYAAINSIRQNTTQRIRIFILSSSLGKEEKAIINSLKNNIIKEVHFLNVNEDKFKDFPLNRDYISVETYYRLLLPTLIPVEIEKILYLDCDIMVLGDISELYDFEFENNEYAVVVEDEGGGNQCNRLGFNWKYKYFNAGVILFNLKKLRNEKMWSKAKSIYNHYSNKILLQDQDILNIYFKGNLKYAPLNWNVGTRLFLGNELPFTYSQDEWKNAVLNPKLVHFTGPDKPWITKTIHPLINKYIKFQHPGERKYMERFFYKIKNEFLLIKNNINL